MGHAPSDGEIAKNESNDRYYPTDHLIFCFKTHFVEYMAQHGDEDHVDAQYQKSSFAGDFCKLAFGEYLTKGEQERRSSASVDEEIKIIIAVIIRRFYYTFRFL